MAVEVNVRRLGCFTSARDLTGLYGAMDGRYRFMARAVPAHSATLDPWAVDVASGPTVQIRGVCQNNPKIGEGASLALGDIVIVRSGAAITAGSRIMCDANGCAVPFISGSGHIDLGEALDAATAADQQISVLMNVVLSNQQVVGGA